eukprot:CAMPEP_0174378840 /NCGR_PEP_ID=MMETSP0811_2-20130205/122309_1 /TAXON_ID=73025 ORGANISM="Eutreptiella gymnastica-like, Strain CCMP1594" /NCGR_SAMPLE_ID=MMETSP0811_2 /ASSEMBLY_ACC=CAM_ASM_000667 /LENGTH=93 /DNA_ID=CAMNT_0015531173 /DNA_START=805 /DNA_END=1087 /DNA_ORIENTATION=+
MCTPNPLATGVFGAQRGSVPWPQGEAAALAQGRAPPTLGSGAVARDKGACVNTRPTLSSSNEAARGAAKRRAPGARARADMERAVFGSPSPPL